MTTSNEELMIASCKDRDQTLFTELMRQNQEMVRRVLGKYGEQLAEDLTQETFLAILTNPERYDSRNNFQGSSKRERDLRGSISDFRGKGTTHRCTYRCTIPFWDLSQSPETFILSSVPRV